MPRRPQINPEDIFEYLRKYDGMTEEEREEVEAELIVDEALRKERELERKNVFMGKTRARKAKKTRRK